jgi:hypothetical protein
MIAHRRTRFASLLVLAFVLILAPARSQEQDPNRDRERSRQFSDRIEAIVDDVLRSLREEFGYTQVDSVADAYQRDTTFARVDSVRETVSFDGAAIIAAGDTLLAHVVVKGGDLTVYGVIYGDVLVVGGSLIVKSGARIAGDARVVNGEIIREDGGIVDGYMDRTSSSVPYRERKETFPIRSYRLNAYWAPENTTLDFIVLRYNRVESIFLGLGSDKRYYWDGSRDLSIYGSIGYGFKSYKWRGNLGLTRQFAFPDHESGSSHLLEVGAEAHSYTDSKDQWLIDVRENSLAAFFIHEDFRDYYQRQGVTALAAWYYQSPAMTTQLKAEMNFNEEASMPKVVDWALFGGNKRFRDNPAATEGRMRSVVLSAGFSTATKTRHGMRGWALYGAAEFSAKGLGSEFSFSQLVVDVRRYQPLGKYDGINLRVRAGTSGGALPVQRTYDVGGLGTLPGFPFKDQTGNRLLLGNVEYIANGDILGDLEFWPSWLMRHINIVFFGDAGWVGSAPLDASWTQGFDSLTLSSFRSDIGFGFSSRNGAVRMGWAWRTDKREAARFVFRIARPF